MGSSAMTWQLNNLNSPLTPESYSLFPQDKFLFAQLLTHRETFSHT